MSQTLCLAASIASAIRRKVASPSMRGRTAFPARNGYEPAVGWGISIEALPKLPGRALPLAYPVVCGNKSVLICRAAETAWRATARRLLADFHRAGISILAPDDPMHSPATPMTIWQIGLISKTSCSRAEFWGQSLGSGPISRSLIAG